ncbi:MAG: electron transporter SenC [Acidobacteria bacterium]|nr:MAG: electron transporter SenC [Acidobacteriota bacterium]
MIYRSLVPLTLAAALLALPACRREPPARQYQLTGHVLAVKADGTEITIRHDDIPGVMAAMTMPFAVKDPEVVKGRVPGDLVKGTLIVTDEDHWLSRLEKTGWAPFPETAAAPPVPLLQPGEAVPDETFIDQDGNAFRLSSLKGSVLLVTFIYTRCPLPDFCPLMDRRFAAIQQAVKDGRTARGIRLLSISFDPDHDTPAALRAHAARLGADPALWTFATAPRDKVDAFGARLGLDVIRDPKNPADITHNLRTAVLDRQGRLVTVLNGNGWSVEDALAALASVPAS